MAMLLVPQPNGNAPGWANGLWASGTTRPRHWFAIAGVGLTIVVVVTLIVNRDQSPTPPPTWAAYEKSNAGYFFKSQEAVEEYYRTELSNVELQKSISGSHSDDFWSWSPSGGEVNALKTAVSKAKAVSPDVLGKAHPQLPEVFKNTYIRALELAIRAHERRIRSQEVTELWNQWLAWWKANKKDVRFPEDVRK